MAAFSCGKKDLGPYILGSPHLGGVLFRLALGVRQPGVSFLLLAARCFQHRCSRICSTSATKSRMENCTTYFGAINIRFLDLLTSEVAEPKAGKALPCRVLRRVALLGPAVADGPATSNDTLPNWQSVVPCRLKSWCAGRKLWVSRERSVSDECDAVMVRMGTDGAGSAI